MLSFVVIDVATQRMRGKDYFSEEVVSCVSY